LLLSDVIGEVHANSRATYGQLRVRAALKMEHGLIVNRKLVARIMRDLNIHGLPQRKKGTRNLANVAAHEDLVNRNFVADRPNALWLTDITEHPTREGTVYCCCVLDIFSRKVVGWAIDRRCESILVNDALAMAARTRITSPSTITVRRSVHLVGLHREHPSLWTSRLDGDHR
jgi:putative transposase